MLNDADIVSSVQAESNPVDDETDQDEDKNNESSKGPSNAGTFSALETATEWIVGYLNTIQNRTKNAKPISYGWTVALQWAPSHVGIPGNVKELTKTPSRELSRLNRKSSEDPQRNKDIQSTNVLQCLKILRVLKSQ
ncbi:hypothetical protein TNCV_4835001 [Trichonephila clavipes]|nr:hypothetical protein TNCV_4835001 [Trichonephila clavipes]